MHKFIVSSECYSYNRTSWQVFPSHKTLSALEQASIVVLDRKLKFSKIDETAQS